MAYDENLAIRIEGHIGDHPAVTPRKMFGGVAYMLRGNMAVGVHKDSLMVRVPPEEHEAILGEDGVSTFSMGEKSLRGFVLVESATVADDAVLGSWIDRGMGFAATFPPK